MSAAKTHAASEGPARPAASPPEGGGWQLDEQAEAVRLLGVAREVGNRIREHLRLEDVVREAAAAVTEHLGADAAWVFLDEGGRPSVPVAGQYGPLLDDSYSEGIPPGSTAVLAQMYRRGENVVIDDLRGPEGDWIAPPIRQPLLDAGVITHMLMPFGVGDTMLGFMTVERLEYRPWTPAEVHTVELVAADVGRAVHHARLYEREKRLVAELTEVGQAKSRLLATVSHELRTPLTLIIGYLEVMLDGSAGPLTGTQARMLASVDRNAVRLRRLIEDVLTLSKIETGAFRTAMRPVKLAGLVTAAIGTVRRDAEAKGVALSAGLPRAGLTVSGDSGQLSRALENLLSNAVKFTPGGGRVRVSATAQAGPAGGGPAAVVSVSDTGMGIPEAEQANLFGGFFRASNAVERAIPGTGLGLAIAHTVVANHGGELTVTSREGEGTTVTLRLPLLRQRRPAGRGTPPGQGKPPGQEKAAGEGRPARHRRAAR